MAWLTQLELDRACVANILPGLVLLGLGLGGVMATWFQVATAVVHHDDTGVASALLNTGQQVGCSISTALLTTVASSAATNYLSALATGALALAQDGVESYSATLAWVCGF